MSEGCARNANSAGRRRLVHQYAACRASLGDLLVVAGVGDTSRNLDSAFLHYRLAASTFAAEGMSSASVAAARIWTKLATAQLAYPSENRLHYAKQAVEVLLLAKEILNPFEATMELAPPAAADPAALDKVRALDKARLVAPYALRLSRGKARAKRTGVIDPITAGSIIPSAAAKADWHLGLAYQQLGEASKATESFQSALAKLGPEHTLLRASIESEQGYALLDTEERRPSATPEPGNRKLSKLACGVRAR